MNSLYVIETASNLEKKNPSSSIFLITRIFIQVSPHASFVYPSDYFMNTKGLILFFLAPVCCDVSGIILNNPFIK